MINRTKRAFTLIELLVVIGIIALLAGILIPAVNIARTKAKEASTRAMIHSIEMGLQMFSNDFGNFPSSTTANARYINAPDTDPASHISSTDLGAHHLFNAMAGIDILGYSSHDNDADNYSLDGNGNPIFTRKDPYINVEKTPFVNFRTADNPDLEWDNLSVSAGNAIRDNLNPIFTTEIKPRKTRPLLYYRANKNENLIGQIYDALDNGDITTDVDADGDDLYPNFLPASNPGTVATYDPENNGRDTLDTFEEVIHNPDSYPTADNVRARPYNAKTYLLISAGADGLYGTEDDITNWAQ